MKILIIDGQSGRLGAQIIEGLRKAGLSAPHQLIAVGTNALATSGMINAGADQGASGENAVVVQCRRADIIAGPIGITLADAMLGGNHPAHGRRRGAKQRRPRPAALGPLQHLRHRRCAPEQEAADRRCRAADPRPLFPRILTVLNRVMKALLPSKMVTTSKGEES